MPRRCSLLVFHGSGSPDVGRDRIMLRGRPWCRVGRRKFTTGEPLRPQVNQLGGVPQWSNASSARRVEQMHFGHRQPELDQVAGPQAMIRADNGQELAAGRPGVDQLLVAEELDDLGAGRDPNASAVPLSQLEVLRPEADGTSVPFSRPATTSAALPSRASGLSDAKADPSVVAVTKFIAGDPMNPATKMLAGYSYSCSGVPTCWRTPSRMTAIRSPMVMASTWSCVT